MDLFNSPRSQTRPARKKFGAQRLAPEKARSDSADMAGSDRRVELSGDGGFNWYTVHLENMSKKCKWSWCVWEFELPYDVDGWVEISRPAAKARLDEFDERGIPFGPITATLQFPSQSWEDYDKFWQANDPRDADDE
ncbi:hypothetical protein MY4038_010319 [Beauveria bassiana]